MFVRPSLIISVAALICVGCGAESHTLRRSSFEKGDEKLSNVVDESSDEGYSGVGQRRELWSWWSMLFLLGPHPPCPDHGPLSHAPHCKVEPTDTSESSSEQTYSSDTSSSQSESGNTSEEQAEKANSKSTNSMSRNFPWMLLVAGAAATAALAAAVIGSRKEPREKHQLEGSVKRRITLFSAFADSALCGATGSRPERVVEMTSSLDGKDTPYRLA